MGLGRIGRVGRRGRMEPLPLGESNPLNPTPAEARPSYPLTPTGQSGGSLPGGQCGAGRGVAQDWATEEK